MRYLGRLLAVAAAGTTFAASAALAPSAGAAVTCTYNGGTLLDVQIGAQNDSAELEIGGGGTILVRNLGAPVACGPGGPPTTLNVDIVAIVDLSDNPGVAGPDDGNSSVRITDPAAFAPGPTAETGTDEIEFAINMNDGVETLTLSPASSGANTWTLGTGGINWNAGASEVTPDAELTTFSTFDNFVLSGGGVSDSISAHGGGGTGGPFIGPGVLIIRGNGGDDLVEGGDRLGGVSDVHEGGPGNDTVRGFEGPDRIADEAGDDVLDGGNSAADELGFNGGGPAATVDLNQTGPQATGSGTDTISGFERVGGTTSADTLLGNAAANTLEGQGGNDTLQGRGGQDILDGGGGTDTASFSQATGGVTVNLTAPATATGDAGGGDALLAVENVIGSPFADTLTGDALGNAITGLGGSDTISALAGADAVFVRDGEPDAATCGSELDIAIADQASVDSVNADCETIDFLAETPPGGGGGDGGGGDGGGGGLADTELSFDLAGKRKQDVVKQKGVVVKASCPLEACNATLSGGGKIPKRPGRIPGKVNLNTIFDAIDPGVTEKFKLKPKRKALRALTAALRDGKKPKLTVSASVTDAAGNVATDKVTVTTKR